ncbi:unnamed protein product, partial [Didymodactylos carnosus]
KTSETSIITTDNLCLPSISPIPQQTNNSTDEDNYINNIQNGDSAMLASYYQQWQQCFDKSSGLYYYWNKDTNECTWDSPFYNYQQMMLTQVNEIFSKNITEKVIQSEEKDEEIKETKDDDNDEEQLVYGPDTLPTDKKQKSANLNKPTLMKLSKKRQSVDNFTKQEIKKVKRSLIVASYDSDDEQSMNSEDDNETVDDQFVEGMLEQTLELKNTDRTMQIQCRTVLEKLRALETICDIIEKKNNITNSRIQLEVRFEDVLAGVLKKSYFCQKLELANEQLNEYENVSGTDGTKLVWSSDDKSYSSVQKVVSETNISVNNDPTIYLSLPPPPPPAEQAPCNNDAEDDALQMFYENIAQLDCDKKIIDGDTSRIALSSPGLIYIQPSSSDSEVKLTTNIETKTVNTLKHLHNDKEKKVMLRQLDAALPGEKRYLTVSSLLYSLLFICIGFPIWFVTTSTYRASLPDKEIAQLSQEQIVLKRSFHFYIHPSINDEFIHELKQHSFRIPSTSSIEIKLDAIIHRPEQCVEDSNHLYIGTYSSCSNSIDANLTLINEKLGFTEQLTSFQTSSRYELSFCLINNEYTNTEYNLDVSKFQSKINSTIVPYVQEYFRQSSIDIDISTQVIYYTKNLPGQIIDKHHTIHSKQLPFFINQLEGYLQRGAIEQYRQKIYFILYMPNKKETPIRIGDQTTVNQILHSFLTPKWGGIVFFNKQSNTDEEVENKYLHQVMNIFLLQLQELLGLIPPKNERADDGNINDWLFKRSVENFSVGRKTLLTLSELLQSIQNIVITLDIAQKIEQSVKLLKLCEEKLLSSNNDLIDEAHGYCQSGRLLADQVFFDQSLLKLLYFPDDQKFAIYIPLFLPVGLPLAYSLFNDINLIIKAYKNRHNPIAITPEIR